MKLPSLQVVTIRDFASHLNRVHAVTLKPKGGRISPKSKTAKKQPKVRRNSNRSPTPDDAALRNPDAKIEKLPENGGWRCPHCEHVCASYSNMQASSQFYVSYSPFFYQTLTAGPLQREALGDPSIQVQTV